MKVKLAIFLVVIMAFHASVHACEAFMVPPPVETLSQKGFQVEVVKDDSKPGSFRFSFTIDKTLPWVAATLYDDSNQSTSLVMSEIENGNRTFSFTLTDAQIAASKIHLTYGKKGDDGHYRGGLLSLELGPIHKHFTQPENSMKNSESEGLR